MIRVLHGDCRALLPTLPDASVHCVVTSPPYWGLRDYGTATWQGGDPGCEHLGPPMRTNNKPSNRSAAFHGGTARANEPMGRQCHCGAIRIDAQLGLEPDFNAYVAAMVAVFREVRRVLRDDGTLWLNLGDSYYSAGGQTTGYNDPNWIKTGGACNGGPRTKVGSIVGLKPKDLCGIPWRVAFALQADGWYLRQDIIWSKPNPMPESVTDRCTKAHEYLFLLSKRPTYYYDAEAIKEPASENTHPGYASNGVKTQLNDAEFGVKPSRFDGYRPSERNKRSVWEVATAPFSEAHFATFPPALIEPCIKAGTSERGCCGKCGKPWLRQVEYYYDETNRLPAPNKGRLGAFQERAANMTRDGFIPNREKRSRDFGWSPSCACAADPVPCTVLDPFGGAGTTGLVADRLQRNAILIELNPAYATMAGDRITGDGPLFAEVST